MPNAAKILIVDADPTSVLQMAKPLRQQGWDIVVASDAVLAQSVVRKENPNVMVLSSHLPGSAVLMLKRIRSSVHTVGMPVIVISKTGGARKEEFIAAGASEYITKPRDTDALCAAIRKHLGGEPAAALAQTPSLAPAEIIASPERMAALAESEVLDSTATSLLDSITRVAASLLRVPTALLSIVDKNRQFFKSQFGLPEPWCSSRQTPLSHSFCQWVVADKHELIVEDARKYPNLQGNLAVQDLGVISYAGIPVFSASGPILGSFCAIDSKARVWEARELAHLRNLARMSESALILERKTLGSAVSVLRSHAMSSVILNATQILRRNDTSSKIAERGTLLEIIEVQAQELTNSLSVGGGVRAASA